MKQPVLICAPYDFQGILMNAYQNVFDRVEDKDWVCFMDGDIAFLEMADFGHLLSKYIKAHPDTGIFTCKASRCHYKVQRDPDTNDESDSIKYIAQKTIEVREAYGLEVDEIEIPIAGHLIMMKKEVWNDILPNLKQRPRKSILGFDTQLTKAVLSKGYKIRLMKGVLVFHYLRFLNGKNDKIQ